MPGPSIVRWADPDLCLVVAGDDDGTPLMMVECDGGEGQLWRPAAETCTRDSQGLCLNQERFRIDLDWRSFDDTTGSGRAVPVGSEDSGLMWFFEAENWELLIKVLDACHINDRLWVFAAATTTVEYTLRITDTETGTVREYFNPLGDAAAAITDTDAFATCAATPAAAGRPAPAILPLAGRPPADLPGLKGACVPSDTAMCLSDNRFLAEVEWRDYNDDVGTGSVVQIRSATPGPEPASGLFWFFNATNWEMLVKVLDACDVNGRFWMLAAATTDVEYTLRVTDTETGIAREYFNPLGNAARAVVDTFETCP